MGDLALRSSWDEVAEVAEAAVARSNVYDLLATLFRAPLSAVTLASLRETGVLDLIREPLEDADKLLPEADDREALETLAIDFTHLFHDPHDHIPLYESVTTDKAQNGELFGAATASVRTFIEDAGLECRDNFAALPDHISVELELMAKLLRKESAAWSARETAEAEQLRQAARRFLEKHLGAWGPDFADRVAVRAETAFYRTIAQLLANFLRMELTISSACAAPTPKQEG